MNKRIKCKLLTLCVLLNIMPGYAGAQVAGALQSISPDSYGLQQATTGEERYWILLKTHKTAIEKGVSVDYTGLDTINITIPQNGESIPLSTINDFAGVVFNVSNSTKDIFLFSFVNTATKVDVSPSSIDQRTFDQYPQLSEGTKLLVIEDKNPWVKNRKGYKYGHVRKDILLLKNGRAKNRPVMPYNNVNSLVSCKYYNVESIPQIYIKNITLKRAEKCTAETFLCNIRGINDVCLENVMIVTPENDMVNDLAISINDCTNVRFKDVVIDGTYSRINHSGYGVCMDNIWNFKADNLKGNAKWGIFGNNNINTVTLVNSDINRFDIHCYGRDVVFKRCKFRKLYNQFSSVYGKIEFKDCDFIDFTPVLFEPSYNAYVKFDLIFKNCVVHSSSSHNYLIYADGLSGDKTNERAELGKQEYPDLYVNGLKVIGEEPYYIYKFSRRVIQWPQDTIPGIKQVKNLKFFPDKNQELESSNLGSLVSYPESKYIKPIFGLTAFVLTGCFLGYLKYKGKLNRS